MTPIARPWQNPFANRPFLFYITARAGSEFAYQMGVVAVGWQVYALTGSAFDLGLVGLVQFIPTLLLTFVAGHTADRHDRVRVVQLCQLTEAVAAAFLAAGSFGGWLTLPEIYAAVVLFGIASAFISPANSALLPAVAPDGQLQKATAMFTGMLQLAVICGPALGGLAYAVAPAAPYAIMTILWLIAPLLNGAIRIGRPPPAKAPQTLSALFAGVGFVRRNPAILGTISLDLFAVLLGGVTALLPIYARDILHTGPWGLGVLRGASAIGALLMTAFLARHTIQRRAGLRMFQSVIVFGLGIIVFAISPWLWLSLLALAVMGAADQVSVVIRVSLVQLATPDAMRGRVGAVNFLFINTSSQLGEFESGMTAALFGAMPAALIGGIGTVIVALLWMRFFPMLRNVERLEPEVPA